MTEHSDSAQTPADDSPPADTDHPADNPAVHIPVERNRTRIQNRFLKHIKLTEDGCWEWTASRFDAGYGQFRVGSTMREAHRVAYRLFALDDIDDDDLVRHKCPERSQSCCNPAHLTTGTHRDNWLDAIEDGDIDLRFTPAQIREIRQRYQQENVSQGELGEEFNVSQVQIGRIVRREDYDFVEDNLGNLSPGRGKDGKLTDEEVREIRRRYRDEDITQHELGDEYGVSKSMIGKIVRRESYTDIEN